MPPRTTPQRSRGRSFRGGPRLIPLADAVPLQTGPKAGHQVSRIAGWAKLDHRARVGVLRRITEEYGRDPRFADYVVNRIIGPAGVQPRNGPQIAAAILRAVQDRVYYVNEPGERLASPWVTLERGYGDCFAIDTLVLRDDLELVPIQDVTPGMKVWGRDRWSTVEAVAAKGVLPVTEVALNNGSVMRLTEGHKLYALSCEKHGPACVTVCGRGSACKNRATGWERIPVSQVTEGMVLLQPEHIDRPDAFEMDVETSWLVGAYIAEGWSDPTRISISGLDGHWKEETKHRAQRYAEGRGWTVRWHRKYLAVNAKEAVDLVAEVGRGAANKQIPPKVLATSNAYALDEGLQLDASRNTNGEGWTFGTVSPKLATQYRVLQRILGRSTSVRLVVKHGGFGQRPIYRVGVRTKTIALRVKAVRRHVEEVPCFDIQTDDHYVYLPEADCTVSNCDDLAILTNTLATSIGLPNRFELIGRNRAGRTVRWVEGTPIPKGWANGKDVDWFHVVPILGWPFGAAPDRQSWVEAEPTLRGAPLGYSIVRHGVDVKADGTLSVPRGAYSDMGPYQGLPRNGDGGRAVRTSGDALFMGRMGGTLGVAAAQPTVVAGTADPAVANQAADVEAKRSRMAKLRDVALEAAVGGIATFLAVQAAERWIRRRRGGKR